MSPNLPAIPMWLWVVFGVLALVQVTLLAIALFDLVRRPTYAVTGQRKWPWVVLIFVINTLGPILYFVLGRRLDHGRIVDPAGVNHGSVADTLYGTPEPYPTRIRVREPRAAGTGPAQNPRQDDRPRRY